MDSYEFTFKILEIIDKKDKVKKFLEKYKRKIKDLLEDNDYIVIKLIKKYPDLTDFLIDEIPKVELHTIGKLKSFLSDEQVLKLATKCDEVQRVCEVVPGDVLKNIKTYLVLESNKNRIS